MTLLVNGRENVLSVEYMAKTFSLYSGLPSLLIVPRESAAFNLRSEGFLDQDQETYDPQMDRFVVSGISVNDRLYLSRNDDGETFSFPSIDFGENLENGVFGEAAILHGPDVINGYHEGNLFLGVVSNVHNKTGLMHKWIHNGAPMYYGPNRCLLKISEPGTYSCIVCDGNTALETTSVEVTIRHEETRRYIIVLSTVSLVNIYSFSAREA